MADGNTLGAYLRDVRAKLDPTAFGLPVGRRRTPGLRREEVAQRANISTAWYTWLEQGRGGAPSAPVLDRIAQALMLADFEREHLFLLALGRPPEARYRRKDDISARLQRVLDRLEPSAAMIRTATWDVLAWNRAAAILMPDLSDLPPEERNILRLTFLDPRFRTVHYDWTSVARFVVSAFRVDAARAGADAEVAPMVEELRRRSPEFDALWQDNEIRTFGEAVKHIRHPVLGDIAIENSVFAVDGRPDLSMMVLNPVSDEVVQRVRALIERDG